MTAPRFVTFIDDNLAINPDHVVYVTVDYSNPQGSCWVHLVGNQPIKVKLYYLNALTALEYEEDEES